MENADSDSDLRTFFFFSSLLQHNANMPIHKPAERQTIFHRASASFIRLWTHKSSILERELPPRRRPSKGSPR